MNRVLTLNRMWHAAGWSSHSAAYTRTLTLTHTHTHCNPHIPRWPIGWISLLTDANFPCLPHLMLITTVMGHKVNYGKLAHWNFEELRLAKTDRHVFLHHGHSCARRDWEVTMNTQET